MLGAALASGKPAASTIVLGVSAAFCVTVPSLSLIACRCFLCNQTLSQIWGLPNHAEKNVFWPALGMESQSMRPQPEQARFQPQSHQPMAGPQ